MVSDSLNGTVTTTRRPGVSFAASLAFENISHRYHSKETIKGVTLKAEAVKYSVSLAHPAPARQPCCGSPPA